MSSQLKSVPDLSANFRPVGIGSADLRKLWVGCGHKSHQGKKRGGVLWLCAACVAKGGERGG